MPLSFDRNVLTETFRAVIFLEPDFMGRGTGTGPSRGRGLGPGVGWARMTKH